MPLEEEIMGMTLKGLKPRLKQWRTTLGRLAAKAETSGAQAGPANRRRIDSLYAKCAATQSQPVKLAIPRP